MDSWVRNKLKDWGLERYEHVFEEEEVDRTAFQCLRDDYIKAMIPKAGPQAIFYSQWNAEFGNPCSVNFVVESPNTKPTALKLAAAPVTVPFSKGTSVTNTSQPVITEVFSLQATDYLDPLTSANSNPFWLIDSAHISLRTCNPITDLIETLRDSVEGVAILHYYRKHRDLEDEHRNLLVEIIISIEMRSSPTLSITTNRLQELAQLIKQTFPTEVPETYYVPYQYNSVTRTKTCAKGKLSNRLGHRRSLLLHCGVTNRLAGTKRKLREQSALVHLAFHSHLENDEFTAEDYEEKIEWLKNSIDPWGTVEKYWSETSKRRIKELNDTNNCSRDTYMTDFPSLMNPITGTHLIEIDFAQIYPEKTDVFFTEYLSFENEILTFCKTKKKRPDNSIKKLIQAIDESTKDTNDGQQSADLKSAATLLLLPLLLQTPSPVATTTSNGIRRPSKAEVQSEFLLYVKSIAELEAELSLRRQRTITYGEREQPLAVIVGKTLQTIEASYVCINDVRYQVPSTLKAIDVTFKSFYALQLDYPKSALLPWMVIQRRLYAIQGETDIVIPCVSKFIGELEQIRYQIAHNL